MNYNQIALLIALGCILGNANAMDVNRNDLFATIEREGLFKEVYGAQGVRQKYFTDSVKTALATDDSVILCHNIHTSSKANHRDVLGQTILHEAAAYGSIAVL